jgi:hypothetical protein
LRVAALFVETNGCYFNLPDVDPWDITRDARTYMGTAPIVAHPPCHLWTSFAFVNYARYGGAHNYPGNDGGCFASALHNVLRCGGVLEHPASSQAWARFGLARPTGVGWQPWGPRRYVCEVWQSAYGHQARKRTWLFYCGDPPAELCWVRREGTHQVGWHDQRGRDANKPAVGKKAARVTPHAFRDALLSLARHSNSGAPLTFQHA